MPVQPVVITDECGNLTGIPVPMTAVYEGFNNVGALAPCGGAETLNNAVWSAVYNRYITGISAVIQTIEEPFLPGNARFVIWVYNPTTGGFTDMLHLKREDIYLEWLARKTKWILHPGRVDAGDTLTVQVWNYSGREVPIGNLTVYVHYIEGS